jgi:hypothetical protein
MLHGLEPLICWNTSSFPPIFKFGDRPEFFTSDKMSLRFSPSCHRCRQGLVVSLLLNVPSAATDVFCTSSLSDESLEIILLYVLSVFHPFQGSAPVLTTLIHAVRVHTRRSLDRHDYTQSIELMLYTTGCIIASKFAVCVSWILEWLGRKTAHPGASTVIEWR